MKIRGRFIGILAVLGLLMALLPLATAGAVTGVVTIGGGEKGQFFSDQTGDNVVTILVKDADLTPLRVGTARISTDSGPTLDLMTYYFSGEKDKTEKFHGGTTNGPCHIDNDDSDLTPIDDDGVGLDDPDATDPLEFNADCADIGKALVLSVNADTDEAEAIGDGTAVEEDDVYAYRFTLVEGVGRDRQANGKDGVGALSTNDLVSVVVNGRSADGSEDNAGEAAGSGPWFTVTTVEPSTDVPGGGITEVTLFRVKPQVTKDSVAITYSDTEFEFDSTTPLEFDETRVRYGGPDTDYTGVTSRIGINGVADAEITIPTSPTLTGQVIVTFAYDVEDTKTDLVTINSASAGDRKLTAVETDADTDTFEAKVAVFTQADYSTINTQAKNAKNDDEYDSADSESVVEVNIEELNATNGLSAADDTTNRSLAARVQAAAAELDLESTAKASEFLALIIPARDGDVIKVTYSDVNPSTTVSKTATVDLAAPVVTLVSPSDGFFTSTRTVTMSVEVVDDGAGVNETDINLAIVDVSTSGINLGSQVKTPIADGYRVTMVPEGTITEGTKRWFVGVEDKVGNIPAEDILDMGKGCDDNGENCTGTGPKGVIEAPKGAGSPAAASAGNPYKFTIDTRAPSLSTGETGLYLKYPGVTKGDDKEIQKDNNRNWIRVVFNVGDGGAPLDPSTVAPSDFEVDGLTPLAAKVNTVVQDDGDTPVGAAVYLQVGQLDTDARPEVKLVGEVVDKAGNTQDEGNISAVSDGLAPTITVAPSTDLAKETVTITISASESLRSNPEVNVTPNKPEKGDEGLVEGIPLTVSLQTGSLTIWTATFNNTPGQASRQYVVVTATDLAEKSDTVGDASTTDPEDDIVSFQVDDADPMLIFKDAAGELLEDSKQTEGAVWLVAEFDEDEHEGDKSLKVTVSEVTLMDTETDEVVTEDVSMVFGGEVICDDHDADEDAEEVDQDKCAQRTLAVSLTPGMYNIAVTGVDETGNEVSDNVNFEVIEANPFVLNLRPGQNFISIPAMPMGDGGNIDTLLSDESITSISTYDRSRELQGENPWLRSSKDLETGMFSGDITAIEPGKAYFINSTASVNVKVKLQAAGDLPPVIPVRQGYNAIGFWSVAGDYDKDTNIGPEMDLYLGSIGWTVAYSYDPTPGKGWEVIRRGETDQDTFEGARIEAGKGYLVYALYDAVLTP